MEGFDANIVDDLGNEKVHSVGDGSNVNKVIYISGVADLSVGVVIGESAVRFMGY